MPLSSPPPLPSDPNRVRRFADPFVQRRRWIVGFMAAVVALAIVHLALGDGWGVAADALALATLVPLARAMGRFRAAARTGSTVDLAEGTQHLVTYVRMSVVTGVVAVAGSVLVLVGLVLIRGLA